MVCIASIVSGFGLLMIRRRRCLRISYCSRASLLTKVDRFIVNFSIFVGRGIGHTTSDPVSSDVLRIFFTASSASLCSNDFTTILICSQDADMIKIVN